MTKFQSFDQTNRKWLKKLRKEEKTTGKKGILAKGEASKESVDNFIGKYSSVDKPRKYHFSYPNQLKYEGLLKNNHIVITQSGYVVNPVKLKNVSGKSLRNSD